MQRSRRLHEVCGRVFLTATSPSDFAAEDYHPGRPRHPADLNATGRKQPGPQAW
jgi:hypothetical protein